MFKNIENLELTDLVDIKFLQEFQDAFSKDTGITTLIHGKHGPITQPSSFVEFCNRYTRMSVLGKKRCNECDIKWGKLAAEKGEPIIYQCHATLTDFVIPIIIEGNHIASIYGGQILTEKPDESQFRKLAREFSINEDEYIEALKKVKIVSYCQIQSAVNLLTIVANAISQVGLKNLKLLEINRRENFYQKIVATIRNSLNIDEIKKMIVKIIGKTFRADRCFIMEYSNKLDSFISIENEYVSSPDIKKYKGTNVNNDVPNFANNLKKGKIVKIKNKEITMEVNTQGFEAEKKAIEKWGVKSAFAFPLFYSGEFLGAIALHYVKSQLCIKEEDVQLLTKLADQLAIAIYHAKLYEAEQKITKREKILRNTIDILRSRTSAEEIKKTFVEIIAYYFDADGCLFGEYNKEIGAFTSFTIEKLKTPGVKSFLGVIIEKEFPEFSTRIKKGKNIIIKDLDEILLRKNLLRNNKSIETLVKNESKSVYAILVKHKDQIFGIFVMYFIKEKKILSNDEVEFLNSLSNQLEIALHQVDLLQNEKRKVENELLLRNVLETIRSSLEMEKIEEKIVSIIGQTLKADRCSIIEFDEDNKEFLSIQNEYLSSTNIKKYKGTDFSQEFPHFAAAIKNGIPVIINNKKININLKNENFESELNAIKKNDIFSAYLIPLYYIGNFLGILSIYYIGKEHNISEEETNLINLVANQIAIAMHQAKLYKSLKKTTANQNAILNNIPFMAWLKDTNGKLLAVNEDFAKMCNAKIPDILGKTDYDFFSAEYADTYIQEDKLTMESRHTISSEDLIEGQEGAKWHETFKSPVFDDKGNVIGTVGLARDITEIKQYQKELLLKNSQIQKKAERVNLIKNVFVKILKTFNINEIKNIVQDVGIITKADRCYFIEADIDNMRGKPIDFNGEYLSSAEIKSVIGYEFLAEDISKLVKLFLDKKDLIVFDYEDIQKNNGDYFEGIKNYSNKFGLKTGIIIPFFYTDKLVAILVIEYVKEKVIPSEEELDFLRILGNQVGIAFTQVINYQKLKETVKREFISRKILETLRSSFDLKEVKEKLVNELGKTFKADRCYFRSYSAKDNKAFPPDAEYLASSEIQSLKNMDFDKNTLDDFVETLKKQKRSFYPNLFSAESAKGTPIEDYMRILGVSENYIIPIVSREEDISCLIFHYSKPQKLNEDDLRLLETIAYQIDIAFEQIRLYDNAKETAQRETILRKILETVRSSLNIKEVKEKVIKEICIIFEADRCYFRSYDKINDKILPPDVEYLASNDVQSLLGIEPDQNSLKYFVDKVYKEKRGFYPTVVNEEFAKNTPLESYMKFANIKADYALPIVDRYDELTWLVLHYSKEDPKLNEDYKLLLETIAYQIDIAFEQIHLYNTAQKTAQREHLYRIIMEEIRKSLDIKETKKQIVNMIGKTLNADRCFIMNFDKTSGLFLKAKDEYLSPGTFPVYDNNGNSVDVPNFKEAFAKGKALVIKNKQIYIDGEKQNFEVENSAIEACHVNSALALPLFYSNEFFGVLSVHYVNHSHEIDDEEINFMNMIVEQIAIAIYQAELFKITKLQAEREKISRNIIEILRSSMDKDIIKRLFVKNIGKYFNADRVFFSDYDPERNIYLPVDKNAEYLSSPQEKSFVGYNWTSDEARDYIRPLLEKREHNIFDWTEYKEKNYRSQGFINLFEDASVKSSYNLPVLYQQEIMGYFCIEFTHEVHKLADEDINRIRSICTQAGIALYQAELYQKSQEADREKGEFIENISQQLKTPLDNIIELSERLPRTTDNCNQQIEDLNNIYENGRKLLNLSEYIKDMAPKDMFKSD